MFFFVIKKIRTYIQRRKIKMIPCHIKYNTQSIEENLSLQQMRA